MVYMLLMLVKYVCYYWDCDWENILCGEYSDKWGCILFFNF